MIFVCYPKCSTCKKVKKYLEDKLKDVSEDEQLKLLSNNGMLVKRPILLDNSKVLVGFKEAEWEEVIK